MKGGEFELNNNEQSQRVRSLVSRHIDQLAIETHCIDLLTCHSQLQCLALLEYQLSMITLMNPIYPWWLSVITIERVQFQWPNRIIPTVLQNKTLNQVPLVNGKLCNFRHMNRQGHTYTSCMRIWSCFRFNANCACQIVTLIMGSIDPYTFPP